MTYEVPLSLDGASLVAQAMALQESGVLIHGMEVTDLSTGYVVQAPPEAQVPEYLKYRRDVDDYPYRATGLSMTRLQELLELVRDVARQRAEYQVWATVNPPTPRRTFPWGLGHSQPDVLLTDGSPDAQGIVAYLRQRGFRARVVDPSSALRIFAELQRSGVQPQPIRGPQAEKQSEPVPEPEPEIVVGNSRRVAVLAAGVVALVILAGLAWKFLPGEGTAELVAEPTETSEPTSAGPTTAKPTTAKPTTPENFEEHRKADEVGMAPAAERAQIPVLIEVPQWRRVGATEGREEYMSADQDMRILVAAKPTPLETQEALDQAVLSAVEQTRINGDTAALEVTGTSPATYRESFPDSETAWSVRLVDGHQLSIGCQVRNAAGGDEEAAARRAQACDDAVATARLDLP